MSADDHVFAARLAGECGRLLRDLRRDTGFADPERLRRLGDRRSHEALMEGFHAHRPEDAVLSEEGADDPKRLVSQRVWIVDPLDGTREFAEEGRTDWAVHVALWERGELTAGAVAIPARDVVLTTAQPSAPPVGAERLRIAVSRTRPPALVHTLARLLDAELVPLGSAGVKTSAVVRGEVDAYVHAGGQYEWDSAAPVAVAMAAGCHASRLDGSPLRYNREDPWLPDLVVCGARHRDRLLSAIRSVTKES